MCMCVCMCVFLFVSLFFLTAHTKKTKKKTKKTIDQTCNSTKFTILFAIPTLSLVTVLFFASSFLASFSLASSVSPFSAFLFFLCVFLEFFLCLSNYGCTLTPFFFCTNFFFFFFRKRKTTSQHTAGGKRLRCTCVIQPKCVKHYAYSHKNDGKKKHTIPPKNTQSVANVRKLCFFERTQNIQSNIMWGYL